jgi:hypothetical protein
MTAFNSELTEKTFCSVIEYNGNFLKLGPYYATIPLSILLYQSKVWSHTAGFTVVL